MSTIADQQNGEDCAAGRERAALDGGDAFFCDEAAGEGQDRHDHGKAAENMARPSVLLYQGVLAVSPAKALPLFAGRGTEGVKHFAQAVRAAVVQAG